MDASLRRHSEVESSCHVCCACTLSSLGGSTSTFSSDDGSCCSDCDSASVISSCMSFFVEDEEEPPRDGPCPDFQRSFTLLSDAISPKPCHYYDLSCRCYDGHSMGGATIVSSTCSSPINSSHSSWNDCHGIFHLTEVDEDYDDQSISSTLHILPQDERLRNTSNTKYNEVREVEHCLPDDVMMSIFSYLDVSSLKQMRVVNRRVYELAGRNAAGWQHHCKILWSKKAHVCAEARSLVSESLLHQNRAMDAYRISCQDGLLRHEIMKEELCFDPITGEGTIWSFRFKKSAGPAWTSFDPWHEGHDARRMVFLADGTVKQFVSIKPETVAATSDDHASKCGRFELLPAFSDAANRQFGEIQHDASLLEMRWRFITQPMDLPARPTGAYIRLTVGGRDVPTYIVHRSPTMDWSFVLESLWAVYTSVPLPRRHGLEFHPSTSVEQGRRRPARMRLRRTSVGGRWLNVADIESDSEDEQDDAIVVASNSQTSSRSQQPVTLDDSVLTVTNRWQWREALLYNYGAITLPEGEGAEAEFDRVWNMSLRRTHYATTSTDSMRAVWNHNRLLH